MRPLDVRVQRLLDGGLTAQEERDLRLSVARDPAAARDLAELEGGLHALSGRPAPALPDAFQARVMARVAARPAPRARPGPVAALSDLLGSVSWPRAAALACALVLFACAGALVGYRAGQRVERAAAAPGPPALPTAQPATVLVRFALTAPEARRVELAGSFNRWGEQTLPLARGANGSWNATVELPRGRYEYAFVVDGERFVADADASDFAEDGFGSRNAVLDI